MILDKQQRGQEPFPTVQGKRYLTPFSRRPTNSREKVPDTFFRVLLAIGFALCVFHFDRAAAESAIELLSGFDSARIQACYPIRDQRTAGEMAKLLFRLRKSKAGVLAARGVPKRKRIETGETELGPAQPNTPLIGDVVAISGTITLVRQYKVPEQLVEFLDLEKFQEVVFAMDASTTDVKNPENETLQDLGASRDRVTKTFSVFAPPIRGRIAKGDRITAAAMVVKNLEETVVYAAGRIAWFPKSAKSIGLNMLAENGVDLSRFTESGSRSRQTLKSEDGDPFYSMLSAAGKINDRTDDDASSIPAPKRVQPLDILRDPVSFRGQWIRLTLSTVRLTKVNVTDPVRRQQIGQDHYFQIDASGDLGNTVVELARQNDEAGDPIRMSGVYPISLVSLDLPQAMSQQMQQEQTAVMMTSEPVVIDGFFYRLWSYTNEFMTREGGGKQVGPLIVVSRWQSVAEKKEPVGGIAYLGYGLAAAVVLSIVATVWWSRRNNLNDQQAKAARETDQIVGPMNV